jgi:hypothetical protein
MSPGLTTLASLYGFTVSAAQFAVQHIDVLKAADNELARRCGFILEATSKGFDIGADKALLLIGVGQSLLGNPLTGALAASGPGNPIVMTCAAIGAIHYGWNAMSDKERDRVLLAVSKAFEVGVEFVHSIARFAIETIRSLMSSEQLAELKQIVAEAAATFGRRLRQITHPVFDRAVQAPKVALLAVGGLASKAWSLVPSRARKSAP